MLECWAENWNCRKQLCCSGLDYVFGLHIFRSVCVLVQTDFHWLYSGTFKCSIMSRRCQRKVSSYSSPTQRKSPHGPFIPMISTLHNMWDDQNMVRQISLGSTSLHPRGMQPNPKFFILPIFSQNFAVKTRLWMYIVDHT